MRDEVNRFCSNRSRTVNVKTLTNIRKDHLLNIHSYYVTQPNLNRETFYMNIKNRSAQMCYSKRGIFFIIVFWHFAVCFFGLADK